MMVDRGGARHAERSPFPHSAHTRPTVNYVHPLCVFPRHQVGAWLRRDLLTMGGQGKALPLPVRVGERTQRVQRPLLSRSCLLR